MKYLKYGQENNIISKIKSYKDHFTKILFYSLKEFTLFYKSKNTVLFNEDCFTILHSIPENSIDMIFADPPYKLSNGGITCQNGKMVNVNKEKWDKSNGFEEDAAFHNEWVSGCHRILKPKVRFVSLVLIIVFINAVIFYRKIIFIS